MSSKSLKMRNWVFVLVAAALMGAYFQRLPPVSRDDESDAIYSVVLRSEIPKGMIYVSPLGDTLAAPSQRSNQKPEPYVATFDPVGYRLAMDQLKPQPQTLEAFEKANWKPAFISPRFKDQTIHVLGQDEGTDNCIALLSHVGYNSEHSQALVSVNYEWSRMDYLLEKRTAGGWSIARRCRGRGDTRNNKPPPASRP